MAATPSETLNWANEAATARFAQRLAQAPSLKDAHLALHGDLGAGKTTFVRHLLRALGVEGRIKSPTYAVYEQYSIEAVDSKVSTVSKGSVDSFVAGGFDAIHFDFYRFKSPAEFSEAGLRDLFAAPGLKLVEWPEKAHPSPTASGPTAPSDYPQADLNVFLTALEDHGDEARCATLFAATALGERLLAECNAISEAVQ